MLPQLPGSAARWPVNRSGFSAGVVGIGIEESALTPCEGSDKFPLWEGRKMLALVVVCWGCFVCVCVCVHHRLQSSMCIMGTRKHKMGEASEINMWAVPADKCSLESEPVPSSHFSSTPGCGISAQLSASAWVHLVYDDALLQARSEVPFS